ncbi:MAG: SRPBCC domain-containing protein [Nitrososphaerales archaeon]
MEFHIGGAVSIKAPLDKVYSSLTDPNFMAGTIPDVISSKIVDSDHFDAKIKVGISLVRGTVEMKFVILDKRENSHAKLVGDGNGAGSKMHIESAFDLSVEGDDTRLTWAADAVLSGLISGIGSQILKGQSEKQVAQIFQNVRTKLE